MMKVTVKLNMMSAGHILFEAAMTLREKKKKKEKDMRLWEMK